MRLIHEYAVGNLLYVDMTGIYHKLDYKKYGTYIITEVFTNGTVSVNKGQVNKKKNIILLKSQLV